jgi:hypothetical protein
MPSIQPLRSGVTRLGGPAVPALAVVPLRERALTAGLVVHRVDDSVAAAAVAASEAWLALTGAFDFSTPAGYGPDAVTVLAAVLQRAAGHSAPLATTAPLIATAPTCPDPLLSAAEDLSVWLRSVTGDDFAAVVATVAEDLCMAGTHTVFAAFADALLVCADTGW